MCGAGRPPGNVMETPPTVVLPVRSILARAVPVWARLFAAIPASPEVVVLEMELVLIATSAFSEIELGLAKCSPRKPARPSKSVLLTSALNCKLLADVAWKSPAEVWLTAKDQVKPVLTVPFNPSTCKRG